MPSTASLTSTSMCSPSSSPCHKAARSSGKRADRPLSTDRTVAPGGTASSKTRRPVPSPPVSFVTQLTTSTGTVGVVARSAITSSRGATGADFQQPQTGRRRPQFVFEVVVEDVDFPLHAVRIPHPELVLVGVTAIDAEFLAHGQAGRLHAFQLAHDLGAGAELEAQM